MLIRPIRVIRTPSHDRHPRARKQAQAQPFQIPRRACGRLSGQTAATATIDLKLNSAIGGASPGSGVAPQRRLDNIERKC
ncbi:MAG: hypothetical protein Q7J35_12100 [Candidatus Methanoperedens sp.]|nr:hypothetical protein [Candidatus Methanoperedens sp.]